MAVNREITTYPHTLTNLLANLKAKQRGVTTHNPTDPNNEDIWKQSKGWLVVKDVDGDLQVMAQQKYYDVSASTWIRRSNVFADIEADQVYTETGFKDQYLAANLPISETGVTALDVAFTATSIVGCLNELKDEISFNPFWKEKSIDTISPRDEVGYDYIYTNSGFKDVYCAGIPLAETGEGSLDAWFDNTSIIGAINELAQEGAVSFWARSAGYIYPATTTDEVRISEFIKRYSGIDDYIHMEDAKTSIVLTDIVSMVFEDDQVYSGLKKFGFGKTTLQASAATDAVLYIGGLGIIRGETSESAGKATVFANNCYDDGAKKRIVADLVGDYYIQSGVHIWRADPTGAADSTYTATERMRLTSEDFSTNSVRLGLGTSTPLLNVGTAAGNFTGDGVHVKSDIANSRRAYLIIEGDSLWIDGGHGAANLVFADNAGAVNEKMMEFDFDASVTPQLTLRTVNDDAKIGNNILSITSSSINTNNNNIYSGEVDLADNAATSFTPGQADGMLMISCQDTGICAIVSYAITGGTAYCLLLSTTGIDPEHFAVYTGALTGTTGADGFFNISYHTDGKIYFENRRGAT